MTKHFPTNQTAADCLCMFGVPDQIKLNGSTNVASTCLSTAGIDASAARLLDEILNRFSTRNAPSVAEADDLEPARLTGATLARLTALPEFELTNADCQRQHQIFLAIRTVRAQKASPVTRQTVEAANGVVHEKFRALQDALEGAVGAAPVHAPEIVEQTRAALRALELPEPDAEPLGRLAHVHSALVELASRRASFPPHSWDRIHSTLSERGNAECQQAIRSLSQELTVTALRRRIEQFQAYLDELMSREVSFLQNVQAVRKEAEAYQRDSSQKNRVSQTSVHVQLPGPSEEEVVQGLMTTLNCSDRQSLVHALLKLFLERLKLFARAHCSWLPDKAPPGILLTRVPAADIVRVFLDVIATSIGPGHTFYEIVEKYGVDRLAQALVNRAKPTCDLRSYDDPRFNLSTTDVTVARLPQAGGPRDQPIRDRLVDALYAAAADHGCQIVDAAPSERTAAVIMRTKLGFPVGVLGCNEPLLMAYARSFASGHLPHLLGFHAGSTRGGQDPAYVELVERLFPELC